MPLVRFELKNEYGLGDSRLYQGAGKEGEDPRNILGGFTVSGLVGILRQLGDLAEFAAVVFHDVHQQVLTTAARGHRVLNHIKKIEAALPQFEKSVQDQKSHIHFAYITGCDWHANIQTGHRELLGSDLPEFVLDSYEKCREPPRLHLLDKFDSAGAGACVKRYSDPSYFQRVMASSESIMVGKSYNGKKVRRKKKQRLWGRNVLARHSVHMTLRSKSLNDSALFAPVVTDELKFSIDDPSTSDTLSLSGYVNELMHLSPDKRSGCVEGQNTPSSISNELYDDGMPAIKTKTKHDVDRILNNYSEVSVSDHVMLNPLFSAPISSNGKTEMITSDSQMLSHDFYKEALDISKAAEFSSALSNGNHGTDVLGVQTKLVSKFLIWDKTTSATCDEVNKIMESTSPRFPDGISYSRSSYLAGGPISELSSQLGKDVVETNSLGTKVQKQIEYQTGGVMLLPHLNCECEVNMSSRFSTQPTPSIVVVNGDICPFRPHDPESLFLTLEQSNQHCEIIGTEMLNQDNALPTTVIEISELTSQLDKHMDSTNALRSLVKKKIECQTGQGVISLPRLNYFDEGGGDIIPFKPKDAGLLFLAPETSNLCCEIIGTGMLDQGSFLLNTMKMVEPSLSRDEMREHISEFAEHTNAANASDYEVHTNFENQTREVILLPNRNYDGEECKINKIPRITIKNMYGLDGEIALESCIPPEQSSSQDSFGNTSANTASHKEVLSEPQTKQEVESTADSNCLFTEYQSSVEKLIVVSNTETHITCYSSSDDYSSQAPSDMITSNTADNVSSSTLSTEVTSSKCLNHVFPPRNISEDPGGNMSTQLANSSIILPSTVTESTVVEFQGFPVDSLKKPSVNIWTNGGLLGLEPSKPSAIGVPSVYCIDKTCDDRLSADSQICVSGNQIDSRNLFFEADKLNNVVSFSEKDKFSGKISDKQSDSALSMKHSKDSIQSSSFCKVEKAQNSCFDGATSDIDRVNEKEGGSIFSEAVIYSKSEPEFNISKKNNIGMSVSFSSLSHRFPVSSLQRKLSMTTISPFFELMSKDDKLDGTSILNKHKEGPKLAISSTQLLQLGNKVDVGHEISENFVSSCSDSSGYQSPPIEHMNVSFQSMNNSDASRMRLEFCNIHRQGNMEGVMFPSFQLLSESFQPVMDGVLESDDDTFCRSCPYSSDDLLTLHSESDGEMWGDDGLYVSNGIEETCSISSLIDDETNVPGVSRVNHITNLNHETDELSFTSK
ncbi:SCAR-like protein 2 [Platanthera zijinensis]|uniref:Protein SCAR n=1 Tax=Platanthera zijinensis TaxID=2320716 RepID=A0AAP0B9C7_9ASPA